MEWIKQKKNSLFNVQTNNSKGYEPVFDGDCLNVNYKKSKTRRGRVAHQMSHTITCNENEQVVVLGNLFSSNHEAGRIVDGGGISPCVKENHGTVIMVVIWDE